MDRERIEEVRNRVSCTAVLVGAGFVLDRRESSPRALKFRRGREIVIVTHGGAGWFDPLSDEKGDVFALASLLERIPFAASFARVSGLAGSVLPVLPHRPAVRRPGVPVDERWTTRPALGRSSDAHRYLEEARALPPSVLRLAGEADVIRQGPHGSAWFAHRDEAGRLSGWEERGPDWRGFSTGGAKTLFRFGSRQSLRLCVTEAAIDALSLAAIENVRRDTLYASTGGGWSPSTVAAIEAAAIGAMLVAATDADPQGEVYADRLRQIAETAGSDFIRLRPRAIDWNEELKEIRKEGRDLPHARATGQG
ncbi:hypothetical protein B5K05_33435 [Rhizobium phaseoli]|uniref:DUF3991 and TOPRIM domain-containing protein n=1 Tax=Rhizobium phaseoli TaxID=396 RepID=UPI000E0D186C|nr:DUF3991 and TOPRIM domain-containing protein [Rhizobium phaseoli]RDJ00776.1 hypothetical protein B5K05_33435 [Rhizobium phaseoli]RDJ00975.1 hypothetical protein B5K04_31515 [Rhizobium phaseoli]